jgi:DNA primase small subunit
VAAKLLTDMLRDDFGLDNCLWVFSGRRGVHCWICDPEARNMTNEMRSAVTQYCNIPGVGNEMSGKVTLQYPLHPNLRKAFEYLKDFFEQIVIKEQDLLSQPRHQQNFLKYLSIDIRDGVMKKWATLKNEGEKMWAVWKQAHEEWKFSAANAKYKTAEKDLSYEELVLCYLYPRLDANVSTGINHLLKSPFCVHPKTGNICVPFDPANVHNFKLAEVPNLTMVINELGQVKERQSDDTAVVPCLEPYLALFKNHIKKCVAK